MGKLEAGNGGKPSKEIEEDIFYCDCMNNSRICPICIEYLPADIKGKVIEQETRYRMLRD